MAGASDCTSKDIIEHVLFDNRRLQNKRGDKEENG